LMLTQNSNKTLPALFAILL